MKSKYKHKTAHTLKPLGPIKPTPGIPIDPFNHLKIEQSQLKYSLSRPFDQLQARPNKSYLTVT
jgi:hypothetical protein